MAEPALGDSKQKRRAGAEENESAHSFETCEQLSSFGERNVAVTQGR